MKINRKRTIVGLLSIFLLCALMLFIVQCRLERMTTHFLADKIPRHIQLNYENIDINIYTGTLEMSDLSIDIFNSQTLEHRSSVAIDTLMMEGFSYWDYFVNKTLAWDDILLLNPRIAKYPAELKNEDTNNGPEEDITIRKPWIVKRLRIQNGKFAQLRDGQARPGITIEAFNATLTDCNLDTKNIRNIIPFQYKDLSFSLREFYMELGAYEILSIGFLEIEDKVLVAEKLTLKTKYGKQELSSEIRAERDHTRLEIPAVRITDPSLGIKDSLLAVAAGSAILEKPRLEVYRDKLVADDLTHKRMYGRMLRELPFHLELPRLDIHKGYAKYEERVDPNTKAGQIIFNDIDASLLNVSNIYESPEKTEISASALFMDDAKVKFDWSFDMNDPEEFFIAKCSFTDFNAANINSFLESNMRMRIEGYINSMYFTVSGNEVKSSGEMKMKYRNLNFMILKEDRSGINKLLTTIGSVFIKQNQDTETPDFRYGQIETERDATKSFFNYLWLNVRSGVRSTLTGDGKKE